MKLKSSLKSTTQSVGGAFTIGVLVLYTLGIFARKKEETQLEFS